MCNEYYVSSAFMSLDCILTLVSFTRTERKSILLLPRTNSPHIKCLISCVFSKNRVLCPSEKEKKNNFLFILDFILPIFRADISV